MSPTQASPSSRTLETMVMRGGTSKGLFVRASELPAPGPDRDRLILDLLGGGDPLQVDGLGGGNPSTSKLVAVSRSAGADADLDYLYAAVTPGTEKVSYDGNCGNLTAAVAMYAILTGLVECQGDVAELTLRNLNTGLHVLVSQPMSHGSPVVDGDYSMDGISRSGAEIVTSYLDPAGSTLGSLLPTGRLMDTLDAGPHGPAEVSFVDVTSPYVFLDAGYFGISGFEQASDLNSRAPLLAALDEVRARAAVHLGLVEQASDAAARTPGVPRLALVATPETPNHLHVRAFSGGRIHHALSATGAMCAAASALVPGTVVARSARAVSRHAPVRVGHAKGATTVTVDLGETGAVPQVRSTSVSRTVRPLLQGRAFV